MGFLIFDFDALLTSIHPPSRIMLSCPNPYARRITGNRVMKPKQKTRGTGGSRIPGLRFRKTHGYSDRLRKVWTYYIPQHLTATPMLNRLYPFCKDLTQKVSHFYHTDSMQENGTAQDSKNSLLCGFRGLVSIMRCAENGDKPKSGPPAPGSLSRHRQCNSELDLAPRRFLKRSYQLDSDPRFRLVFH